jgi:hypothetical protein
MKEVSKEQFKNMYFKLHEGWGQDYWDKFFEKEKQIPMKYLIQEPESPRHSRMMIVSDYGAREYRLFFLTLEEEEGFFRQRASD